MRRLLMCIFTFLFFASCLAQNKHPFTFEDMMALKRVGEPVPSPDGKWVLFSAVDVKGKTAVLCPPALPQLEGVPGRQAQPYLCDSGRCLCGDSRPRLSRGRSPRPHTGRLRCPAVPLGRAR